MFDLNKRISYYFEWIIGMTKSNIRIIQKSSSKIPENYTSDETTVCEVLNEVVTIRDNHNCVTARYNYKNGKLEGISKFYECGCLIEKRNYVNNVGEIWSRRIENFKESGWFVYENDERKYECKLSNELDFYKYFDSLTCTLFFKYIKI